MDKIPEIVTTTHIQRKLAILTRLSKKKEASLIFKDGIPLGFFLPMSVYDAMLKRLRELDDQVGILTVRNAELDVEAHPETLQDADEFFAKIK